MSARVILLGPPASGKGTQGRAIAEALRVPYLGTGALLREILRRDGPEAGEIRPVLQRGGYVEDALMCRITAEWLEANPGGWVLDGFPRTLAQDDFLSEYLGTKSLTAAVSLVVPQELLLQRIKNRVECPVCRWTGQREDLAAGETCPRCGTPAESRADDKVENFLLRYAEYETHTVPVIDRHAATGLLIRCQADREIAEVTSSLLAQLEPLISHGKTSPQNSHQDR